MSQRRDPPHGPSSDVRMSGGADATRRTWRAGTVALVSAIVVCCLLAVVLDVGPATTAVIQGVPDPEFRTSVTYTPERGPPSPILLDTRPEALVRVYLADYLRLAGTFPCVQDLGRPYDDLRDPVLNGEPCPVTRPVATATITSVTIRAHGWFGEPDAIVRFVIAYRDGSQWAGDIGMTPDRFQFFWPIYTHLDCWSGSETFAMFGRLVPEIPRGAGYGPPGGRTIVSAETGRAVRPTEAPFRPLAAH